MTIERHYCPMTFGNPDDRGAWQKCDEDCAWLVHGVNGRDLCAVMLIASGLSSEPEERTCRVVPDGCMGRCSACGEDVFADPNHRGGYCPVCGAKVVGE